MPLPLLRPVDSARFVCVHDDAVTETDPPELPVVADLPEDPTDEQVEAHAKATAAVESKISAMSMRWIPDTDATLAAGAVVATVKSLDHLVVIRLHSVLERNAAEWLVETARAGVLSVSGPGLPKDVKGALRRLPQAYTMSLGRAVWEVSTNAEDPTDGSE